MSEARINLGLRDVNAPGKKPGSGCGCGRHGGGAAGDDAVTAASVPAVGGHAGCGCGGKRRQQQAHQPVSELRAEAVADAARVAAQLGVELAEIAKMNGLIEQGLAAGLQVTDNPARATDLDD
ncbi:MAG: hypothetical protein Q4D73_03060 [Actinomycetaceae bacterium]|nr:hypothetical protein [Actinomycetaceae bacterium]